MKGLAFAFILLQSPVSEKDIVSDFHKLNTKQEEALFIETYKNHSIDASAYIVALEMKKAQYTILPWRKWSIFQTQKESLNQLIKRYPQNIHLRYIRLVLQEQTPAFLGYNEFIEEDKNFLQYKLQEKDITDYMDIYITNNTSL